MPDALKNLYISYPFMQVPNPPEWYRQVKDARVVAVFQAANLDTEKNDDNIVATLTAIVGDRAMIHVDCKPLGSLDMSIQIYRESDACPGTQSFFIVSDDMDLTAVGSGLSCRLHPDCVLILQEAPMIAGNTTSIAGFYNGNNMSVVHTTNGILLYGAAEGGTGLYRQELKKEDAYLQGNGLRSINGLSGDVWVQGSYPVDVRVTGTAVDGYTMSVSVLDLEAKQ